LFVLETWLLIALLFEVPSGRAAEPVLQFTRTGLHENVIEALVPRMDPLTGRETAASQHYTQVEDGLNYWDTEIRSFAESREVIESTPTGAAALKGQHRVLFSSDVNDPQGSVDFEVHTEFSILQNRRSESRYSSPWTIPRFVPGWRNRIGSTRNWTSAPTGSGKDVPSHGPTARFPNSDGIIPIPMSGSNTLSSRQLWADHGIPPPHDGLHAASFARTGRRSRLAERDLRDKPNLPRG